MLPYITKIVRYGTEDGIKQLARIAQIPAARIGIDYNLVDRKARAWAEEFTIPIVSQISKTNMDAFLREFGPWQQSGKPLRFLIEAIEPSYGIARAKMIAVTEYGRAVNNGNIIAWRESKMVEGKGWLTVNDSHVSLTCEFLNNKVVPLDGYFIDEDGNQHFCPPGHPSCRSRLKPVLTM